MFGVTAGCDYSVARPADRELLLGVNDATRFPKFASFIADKWSRGTEVADIAGGRGNLTFYLRQLGYASTIIDVRETHLPGRLRRALRKESRKTGRNVALQKVVGCVEQVDLQGFDLLAGLHPDQATEHVIRRAMALEKDFAVVPCCVFPIDGVKRSKDAWFEYLRNLCPGTQAANLPCEGDSLVFYRLSEHLAKGKVHDEST